MKFKFCDCLAKVRSSVDDKFMCLIREGKKVQGILPNRRGAYKVVDDTSFDKPLVLHE